MKKILAIFVAVVLAVAPLSEPRTADAAEIRYGRALHADVGFYKDQSGSDLLFFLPYSYYVKVLVPNDPYSFVECYGAYGSTTKIVGYVLTDQLYFDGTIPSEPYLDLAVSIRRDAFLYADRNCTEKRTKLFYNDRNANNGLFRYYGYAYDAGGNEVYYVEFFYDFGYLRAEDTFSFAVPDHPFPVPTFQPDPPPVEDPPHEDNPSGDALSGMQIAIICCIVLAGIFVAAFLFRPPKKRRTIGYDEDYE